MGMTYRKTSFVLTYIFFYILWTFFRWPGRDLARRNLLHLGQCTLVRVAWAEPGLPTSGRDMLEDWLEDWMEDWREDWREDLRFLEEVEEVEVSGTTADASDLKQDKKKQKGN